jgi:hypothetical protein
MKDQWLVLENIPLPHRPVFMFMMATGSSFTRPPGMHSHARCSTQEWTRGWYPDYLGIQIQKWLSGMELMNWKRLGGLLIMFGGCQLKNGLSHND